MIGEAASKRRLFATAAHFGISALVAAVSAAVIFGVWYPYPYFRMAGGIGLFGILFAVDVTLGPTLTAVIASPKKPRREFLRDLLVIVAFQVAALAYGVYTIAIARPVVVSFEIDRFRVLAAVDIDRGKLHDAPPDLQRLSWTGPVLIAAVRPTDPKEDLKAIDLGLAGFDLSFIPKYWRDYATQSAVAWKKARPLQLVLVKYPSMATEISQIAGDVHLAPAALRFLPFMSRQASWIAVVAAPDAHIVGYLPVDGFF